MELIALSDYLLFGMAFVWLTAASIADIKKREVANWLSFSLLAIALGIRAISSIISSDYYYLLYGILGMSGFLVLANLLYYTKIFAGGDAKLLIALGAAFATRPHFMTVKDSINLPFLAVFLLNILIIASAYGIIYSIGLALKNKKKFAESFVRLYEETTKIRIPFLIVILVALIILFINKIYELILLVAVVFIFPYLYIFVKSVENSCMIKLASPDELTEGDWTINSVRIGKKIIKPTAEGLSPADIKLLKKAGKKILIKQGIPFIPAFLATAIISVLFGNLFLVIAELVAGI